MNHKTGWQKISKLTRGGGGRGGSGDNGNSERTQYSYNASLKGKDLIYLLLLNVGTYKRGTQLRQEAQGFKST